MKSVFVQHSRLALSYQYTCQPSIHFGSADRERKISNNSRKAILVNEKTIAIKLTVELSLSLLIAPPLDSPSELEPAGDFTCELDDLMVKYH